MKQLLWFGPFTILFIILGGCSSIKPEEFNKLKADNSALTNENQKLKNDVAALQDLRDNLRQEFAEYSNDNISLKNQADSTKGSLGRQIDSLNTAIKNDNLKIGNLQQEITNRDSQINDQKKTINSLTEEQAKQLQDKNQEISNITETHNKMEAAMQAELASGNLKIKEIGDVLSVDFQDKIFFDSGSADIGNSGKKTLNEVAKVLKAITNKQIRIEGYTDNDPIDPGYKWRFPSNWELSTARAASIVRYLQTRGIDPTLLKATGYGEYNPVASNDTPEGKAQNRRIVILLVPLDERARYR